MPYHRLSLQEQNCKEELRHLMALCLEDAFLGKNSHSLRNPGVRFEIPEHFCQATALLSYLRECLL